MLAWLGAMAWAGVAAPPRDASRPLRLLVGISPRGTPDIVAQQVAYRAHVVKRAGLRLG